MRPISLKLKGFTAFRDEQEIDFRDLDLFVLWGPTGSGKSSLLDAITYALFGYVERVGNQMSQLVSHGQPRLSVTLEFAVGDRAYRVTRSTAAKGPSKALLERREGDDWESFDEGADQVREVNRLIQDLIGLDYDAFTRSVILPQGRFAEFLSGDAAKRREILTELLGLELFGRMSQQANVIARNAKTNFENKTELLQREYAGISEESLAEAREQHDALATALTAAEQLEKNLSEIEKRWSAAEAGRKSIANCAVEVHEAAKTFSDVAIALDAHAKTATEAKRQLAAATTAVTEAERVLAQATKKRLTAEGKGGTLEDLAGLRTKAEMLAAHQEEDATAAAAIADAERAAAGAQANLKDAEAGVASADKQVKSAVAAREKAEGAHAAAHQQDLVGSLVADLSPGDPCPVCERPLKTLPKAQRKQIQATKKSLDDAKKAETKAAAALAKAETAHAVARHQVETAQQDLARCKKESAARKARLTGLVKQVAAATGSVKDPLAQLDKQIAALRQLIEAEQNADEVLTKARAELSRRELQASKLDTEVDKLRSRMTGVPLAPMCARAHDAAPDLEMVELSLDHLPEDIEGLAATASQTGKELSKLAEDLDALHAARERALAKLVAEARDVLPQGIDLDPTGLSAIVAQARSTTNQLRTDVAVQERSVADLANRLETKAKYEAEIEGHRKENAVYAALARELRSDSIVQYLQAEALEVLAGAASVHLQELSSNRYRLSFEEDRFFVIDGWNGDERRNVRTLSGGETFLASLALALALSEQVQLLAVVERNRLDSLFLDEGFGTLDAETLDVVVDAISQLGDNGRLVGVITHVEDLADRLPVKINVTKSPRGSTLSMAEPASIEV